MGGGAFTFFIWEARAQDLEQVLFGRFLGFTVRKEDGGSGPRKPLENKDAVQVVIW